MIMCINPIVKAPSYNNKLLHMCSNNNGIKQIDNNKIYGRGENTGEGVLLTMGSAEGVKIQMRYENTGKYTGQTFLTVIVVINVRHF